MSPINKEILFLDKDGTLGGFSEEGLYPGVEKFLSEQARIRKLYIASSALITDCMKDLQDVSPYLSGYFGRGEIGRNRDRSRDYENPYCSGHTKDLHIARLMINPDAPKSLPCVMIGDHVDAQGTTASAPEIPLVVISDRVRAGEWHLVANALGVLFSTQSMPHEVYDQMLWNALQEGSHKSFQIGEERYQLEYKQEFQERLIFCPD